VADDVALLEMGAKKEGVPNSKKGTHPWNPIRVPIEKY
jgi:hypothetical protein